MRPSKDRSADHEIGRIARLGTGKPGPGSFSVVFGRFPVAPRNQLIQRNLAANSALAVNHSAAGRSLHAGAETDLTDTLNFADFSRVMHCSSSRIFQYRSFPAGEASGIGSRGG